MTLLSEAFAEKQFDIRMIDRHLRSGDLTQAQIKKNESILPDDAQNGVWVSILDIKANTDDVAVK